MATNDLPDLGLIGEDIKNRLNSIESVLPEKLSKTEATSQYLGVNAKALSAASADSATKATKDGDGNVISTTYLKKTEKAASATTADSATTAGSATTAATATKATQDANGSTIHTTYGTKIEVGQRILANGARGSLAGYETSGASTTINATSPDANEVGSAITVSNGSSGTSWTKVVRVTGAVTVTLDSAWVWQGGSAPTIVAGGVLVCCWCGSGGIANFVSPS